MPRLPTSNPPAKPGPPSAAPASASTTTTSSSSAGPSIPPFPGTSFTKLHPKTPLPAPAAIRARNKATRHPDADDPNAPPPVRIPELGLLVKYGRFVTVAELEAQRYVHQKLRGKVPVPEVVGWAEDGKQGFIYMLLVGGETLAARWGVMSEKERGAVCRELRGMVREWRGLRQEGGDVHVGAVGKLPLGDVTVRDRKALRGPFKGSGAVQAFHKACDIDIADQTSVVFTHADLVPCNILVTAGANPKVAAVIDWAQAGWYPSYWEWCKAKWVDMPSELGMSDAVQKQWKEKYLPQIMDPLPDSGVYYPWLRFVLSNM